MGKRLEDRSLEELWQLFPIFLVPYMHRGTATFLPSFSASSMNFFVSAS